MILYSAMEKFLRKARGFAHSTTHFGGALSVARKLAGGSRLGQRAVGHLEGWMGKYTDYRTRAFDRKHGTDTFERAQLADLQVAGLDPRFGDWLYGPINPDFFAEMMRALPLRLGDYGFVDVGAGKGLALMLASEYPFRELLGIEFSPELVEAGKKNVEKYERSTGRSLRVEWVCDDFMAHALPPRPSLFFLNNPFPHSIATHAITHIEKSIAAHPRKVALIYRKPHGETVKQLDASPHLRPLKSTPFWHAYEAV